jgi:iron(III) transport system ATP-binding protein
VTERAGERADRAGGDVLDVRGVRKAFGGVAAVDGVDLTVADHELVALVGPSGCGKSTLLRLAAGLEAADAGEIRIGGDLVDDGVRRVEPEHRRTGLVFQEHALFPHLSVADNITFGLRGTGRAARAARCEHWLGVIGLSGYGDRYPHELSGGERQRVALARALAPGPRLVLLDEPFASLDPNLRARLRTDIVDVLRATATPALFVTHDQAEALSIGDRVVVMRAGCVEQVGAPDDVYHRPATRFVAGFMGDAAFLPVADGQTELGPCPAPDGTLLVVRPHDVTPTDDGLATVVRGAEFHGPTRTYRLVLPSGTEILATVAHTVHAAPGSELRVALRPGDHAVVPA